MEAKNVDSERFVFIEMGEVFSEKDQIILQVLGEKMLRYVGRDSGEINLISTDKANMQELNYQYNQINKPTDVLSWSYYEESHLVYTEEPLLGEIVICLPICQEKAVEYGWEELTEIIRLIVHGFAHIVGFDHQNEIQEKEMLFFEQELLKYLGFFEIYPN